ncbi:DNA topoisomerase IB [soil metagenome]
MIDKKSLTKHTLRYSKDSDFSIQRIPHGKGFVYKENSQTIFDPELKERIKSLIIPPAWQHVLISKSPHTHIQAIGFDAKNRKQYIYNNRWTELQQEEKFKRISFFGDVLPEIRKKVHADMKISGLARDRVLAAVVWLLEHTFIRIGNDQYAKDNKTYGLTTIENRHVEVDGEDVLFQFKGKSGVYHSVKIHNPRVAKVIYACQELPEQQLFEYKDVDGSRRDVSSEDVNAYLHAITGSDISAKDFRTWGGTVYAADTLNQIGIYKTQTEAKKNIRDTIKLVSSHLRNTTAVCRKYYVHPKIIHTYEKKVLIPYFENIYQNSTKPVNLRINEYATLSLINDTTI